MHFVSSRKRNPTTLVATSGRQEHFRMILVLVLLTMNTFSMSIGLIMTVTKT